MNKNICHEMNSGSRWFSKDLSNNNKNTDSVTLNQEFSIRMILPHTAVINNTDNYMNVRLLRRNERGEKYQPVQSIFSYNLLFPSCGETL